MPTYSIDTATTSKLFKTTGLNVAAITNVVTMATTDLDLNDTFDICRLPRGARVLDIVLSATDMDSGTTLTIDVGDSGDTDRFIRRTTVGQTAGTIRAGNDATAAASFAAHTRYTAETLIYGTIQAAATTPVAGTVNVTVLYTCED